MKEKSRLHLFLGFLVPVVFVLAVVAMIKVNTLDAKPNSNFLYSSGGNIFCSEYYSVKEGKLVMDKCTDSDSAAPTLYIYEIDNSKSRKVTFDEVKDLKVRGGSESDDGFEVIGKGFCEDCIYSPFEKGLLSHSPNRFLKHGYKTKGLINIEASENRLFRVLGWIKK